MARVKIAGLDNVKKSLTKKISKDAVRLMERDDNRETKNYRKQIRDGKNPKTGKGYRGLKPSTINRRRVLSKKNRTHRNYSATKSNLTFTGQLVDSVKIKTNKSKGIIEFLITGTHKPYKGVRGKRLGIPVPNAKIVEGLEKQGRFLVSLSKKLERQIQKRYEKALSRVL